MIENKAVFDCLSRSRELTAFYRWHILGLFIAYAIMAFILSLVITPFELQVMAAAASGSLSTVVLVVYFGLNAFITMVQSVIGSAGIAATYFELRAVKEGIGPEALAAVFD